MSGRAWQNPRFVPIGRLSLDRARGFPHVVGAYIFNGQNPVNLANGAPLEFVSTNGVQQRTIVSPEGQVIRLAKHASDRDYLLDNSLGPAAHSLNSGALSAFVRVRLRDLSNVKPEWFLSTRTSGNQGWSWGTTGASGSAPNRTFKQQFTHQSVAQYTDTVAVSGMDDVWGSVGFSHTGETVQWFSNGAATGSPVAVGGYSESAGPLYISRLGGSDLDASDEYNASNIDLGVCYLFRGALTEAQQAWLHRNPYALLRPVKRRTVYVVAGGGGITGNLSQTLDGATLSAGGALAIEGEAAPSLDGATVAATGELPIEAGGAATLGGASLGATGELPIEGQAAASLDGAGIAAEGALAIEGQAAPTLEGATLAATGEVGNENSGEVNVTLDGASAQAQGTLAIEGTATISLGGVTLTATGGEKEPEPEHPPPPGGGDSRKRRRKLRRPKYAYEIEEERKRRILVTAEKRRRREEEARKAAETPAEAPQRQEPVARLADLPQAAELARLAQVLEARTGALPPVEIAELEDAKARAEARRAAETRRFEEARRRRAEIAEAKRLEEDEEAALILLLAA